MPFNELRRHGWDVSYGAGRPKDAQDKKVIVGQRLDSPGVLAEWRRMRARSRLVYEIDDDVWSVPVTNWIAYRAYSRPAVQDAVETAAMVADVVTVTTEPLAEIMRQFNPEVRVIPNCVPAAILDFPRPIQRERRVTGGRKVGTVTIGYQGGASHALDVQEISKAIRHVLRRNPRAELHLVGQDYRSSFRAPARYTPWVPADASLDYYRLLSGFDIALAPLAGLEFDLSKSGIKVIEAMALGIPVLASDVGPYRDFVQDGKTGYLIRKPGEWGRRLDELINDNEARLEMGRNAREAAKVYTVESGYKVWADLFEELL